MKVQRRCIAMLTGAAMLSSVILGSCSSDASETSDTTESTTETTADTSVSEETTVELVVPDPSDIEIPSYNDTSYSDYYTPYFESTNGELQGQDEYMRLRMYWGQPKHYIYDDLEEIEDPDTRELAQTYADQGYIIYAEEGISTFGDLQYEFSDGFGAQYMDDSVWITVSVARMNETLFNYFVREGAGWNEGEGERTDDGTIVRYNLANEDSGYSRTFEFSRETGFLVFTEVIADDIYWPIDPDNVDYRDEILEAYALACIDDGYILYPNDNIDDYNYVAEGRYTCSEGFYYWDGAAYVEYVAMEEDMFFMVSDPSWCATSGNYDTIDDDVLVQITYRSEDGTPEYLCEYDRSTGLAHFVYLFDC